MRNLKRALSLALASVMVLGMMVIGAGAVSYNDFTDKDEITNVDAVSMVTELGIINGLPNGTFGPTQNVDRASFVKMVAMAYNGGREPMLPSDAKNSYVDTAGTWASQYIEYCTNLGFVAGDGTTGKFNPTANVTVSQAAKMLLVALGYNADIEKYVGLDWQINVDAAANTAGLYNGLSGSTSTALTRDNAAQMIYNALSAEMVKYEGVYDLTTGTMKPQLVEVKKNLLESKFGAVKVEGIVTANEYAGMNGSALELGKTSIDAIEDGYADGIYKISSTMDMLGKKVTMFVKYDKSGAASKATVLGSLIVSDDNKVVTTTADKTTIKLEELLKDSKLSVNSDTLYTVNFATAVKNALVANPKGAEYTFIDNDGDGKVEYAIQIVKTFGKVTSYNTKGDGSISVNLLNNKTAQGSFSNTDAIDEVNGFEDVAKDDYVLCYKLGDAASADFYIELADSIEGTLSSVKGGKAVVDGTTYEQSGLVTGVSADAANMNLATAVADSLGKTVVFYLDAAGNVALVTDVQTSTDYLYVLSSDTYKSFDDSIQAKIVLADGTKATANIDTAILGNNPVNGTTKVGENLPYTYTVNSKGVYKLTAVAAGNVTSITTVEKGNAALASGVTANSKTVFVINNGNSYSVYTGIGNVPSFTTTAGKAVIDSNDIAKVVFATNSTLTGAPESIYVLDKNPTITNDKNGDKVYTYDVIYKGEKTTMTGDPVMFADKGLWSGVKLSSGEIISIIGATVQQPVAATKASNGIVSNGGAAFTYNDKTVFLIVDGTDVEVGSVDSITIDTTPGSKNTDNIVIVAGDDAFIAATVYICK